MKQHLKKHWLIYILIIILIPLGYQGYNFYVDDSRIDDWTENLKTDSTKRKLKQDRDFFELEKDRPRRIAKYKKLREEKIIPTNDSLIYALIVAKDSNEYKIVDSNNIAFKGEILTYLSSNTPAPHGRINVWLLLFIIVLCGLIGGAARKYYPLLEEYEQLASALTVLQERLVETKAEEACNEKMLTQKLELMKKDKKDNKDNKDCYEEFSMMEFAKTYSTDDLLEVLLAIKKQLEEIKKPSEEELLRINIIYGLIASGLSFLALTTFTSKVLDFSTTVHYFIFAGWCLIGAVFAKKWLQSIYAKIVKG